MNLKYKVETIITIDSDNLNKFIKEYYGYNYDVEAILESRSDSVHSIGTIIRDFENLDLEHPDITEFKNGKDVWIHPSDFVEDLVNKGDLPSGKYIITT